MNKRNKAWASAQSECVPMNMQTRHAGRGAVCVLLRTVLQRRPCALPRHRARECYCRLKRAALSSLLQLLRTQVNAHPCDVTIDGTKTVCWGPWGSPHESSPHETARGTKLDQLGRGVNSEG